jgi:hypothetical protein
MLECLAVASAALEPYKNLIDLSLTVVIGLATLYIAVRQYRLEQAQDAREELDRRLAVYEVLQRLLVAISTSGHIPADEFNAFARIASTKRVRPLFNKRDRSYIEEIRAAVRRVHLMDLVEAGLGAEAKAKQTLKRLELVQWLVEQEKEVKNMFSRYLPAED